MTNLKPSNPEPINHDDTHQSFQDLLCSSETESFSDITKPSSVPNSITRSPAKSPITSPDSVSSQGSRFRTSILKHGLTALEKIGRTTADVVVNTRNKIIESTPGELDAFSSKPLNPVEPDYKDSKSTFYEVFQNYGGHSKLSVVGAVYVLFFTF